MINNIKKGSLVLFQGDSVTDCGRTSNEYLDLGYGYANMVSAWLTALYPEKQLRFLNRGISGNRVSDLKNRWKEDCIDLRPDVVSILIGINDCWRRYDSNDPTSVVSFETIYREIITSIKQKIDAEIIIMEPFLLPVIEKSEGWSKGQNEWREDLDPKIHVARSLAREFNATFVPLDGVFARAATVQPMERWTEDGVHPTQAGHALISRQWLKAFGAM
ncbi:SGNH/GDSL hydrolase family protein [Vallitalea sediminicola]